MSRKRNRDASAAPGSKKRCKRCGCFPCRCSKTTSLLPEQQSPRVSRDCKGRGGNVVTVVRDLQLSAQDLTALGRQLKKLCGAGGTVKGDNIEIQGDHREQVAAELLRRGYKVKLAGG